MMEEQKNMGHSRPPEGVLAGEDVPNENQEGQYSKKRIDEVVAQLKTRGEPYTSMKDEEIREKAREITEGDS